MKLRTNLQHLLFVAVVFASSLANAGEWTTNELSILLPLPRVSDLSSAIPLKAAITLEQMGLAAGQTVSAQQPDAPKMMSGFNGKKIAATDFESTYLVGIRIDPCFKETFADVCRKQMRLVWQPLAIEGGRIEAVDGAIHTFHDLSDKNFDAVLEQMKRLNSEYKIIFQENSDLQVHPVLKKAGYQSQYYKRLSALLRATLKHSHLTRIALMELHAMGEFWDFFAVDFGRDGAVTKVRIPDFPTTTVEFSNIFQRPEEAIAEHMRFGSAQDDFVKLRQSLKGRFAFKGVFGPGGGDKFSATDPRVAASPTFFNSPIIRFLKDSEQFPKSDFSALKAKVDEVNNPNRHLPGTIDCVSCHTTQTITSFFKGDSLQAKSIRAFGYFKDTPSISQRTKNETDMIVRALNH